MWSILYKDPAGTQKRRGLRPFTVLGVSNPSSSVSFGNSNIPMHLAPPAFPPLHVLAFSSSQRDVSIGEDLPPSAGWKQKPYSSLSVSKILPPQIPRPGWTGRNYCHPMGLYPCFCLSSVLSLSVYTWLCRSVSTRSHGLCLQQGLQGNIANW